MTDKHTCLHCGGNHVVKNGMRKDGTQRFLCRDCKRSFIPSSHSVTSRTRKHLSVWSDYLKCMLDKKTLSESADECHISLGTAFTWRHKILNALTRLTDKVYLDGTVEADETFFNLSYKGNHTKSHDFTMPRASHKRGNDVHTKGLSSDKVCVPCAVSDSGLAYAKPVKLGKISSDCVLKTFGNIISNDAILCTDNERAYLELAKKSDIKLIQTDTDNRLREKDGDIYGVQLINAYHARLKKFIRRFNGVSTKHLGNYIVCNDIISYNHRDRKELLIQLLGQLLCLNVDVNAQDIFSKSALPCMT